MAGYTFDETAWQDLVTAAVCIREPILVADSVVATDTLLLQLIDVASIQIQRFIGYQYSAAQVAAGLPADLVYAASHYVAYLWMDEQHKDGGTIGSESLGQYSVTRASGGARNPYLDGILGLLKPFRHRRCPVLVKRATETYNDETVSYFEEDE